MDQLNTYFSPIPTFLFFIVFGGVLGWLSYTLWQTGLKKRAEFEAAELLQEVRDQVELRLLDEKETLAEVENELWTPVEKEIISTEEKIENLETSIQERKQKLDNQYSQLRQKVLDYERNVNTEEQKINQRNQKIQSSSQHIREKVSTYIDSLCTRLTFNRPEVLTDAINQQLENAKKRSSELLTMIEEDTKEHSETKAKQIFDRIFARFARPYSAERGIAPVYFETDLQRKILGEAQGPNIKMIQDFTGCDIVITPEMDLVGVAGYDPVRRELTRRLLERVLKEKRLVNPEFIKRTGENIKKEILATVKRDGDLICKELKLDQVHPEVRQMMGALRYRYSFTQNQYFHCGEVGWLCGLLASELGGVAQKTARRSGLLHDLGKSMDHEMEGGHAVIGANFIEKRGESAEVVHAVRAHHFDVQPHCDLDYLVIAADAISGARPGARRSTVESYTQKINELESIARSFDGVVDCYILYGGRECRVIVNGKRIDDWAALEMSRKIARRIEEECNYPGQIKVVVVRETHVIESTRPAHVGA